MSNVVDSSAWLEYLADGPNAEAFAPAIDAAALGRSRGLALADSIVYATTQAVDGTLWTQDEDFRELPSVEFRRHRPR